MFFSDEIILYSVSLPNNRNLKLMISLGLAMPSYSGGLTFKVLLMRDKLAGDSIFRNYHLRLKFGDNFLTYRVPNITPANTF